jgi:hypothetical protein
MDSAKIKNASARVLFPIGVVALVAGALDPLEGAVLILAGSGLVAFATWLRNQDRSQAIYRTWLFGMIALGILAMFVISHLGGVGGKSGRSMWWLLVMLPYPVGWLLEIANLIARGIDRLRHRPAA